jgi:hypothetical protein
VAINLGASQATVQLNLEGLPPQLLGQRPSNLLPNNSLSGEPKRSVAAPILANRTSIDVVGRGYAALAGLRLPRWDPQGYKYNCSATYAPPAVGEMPLAECLVACLADAKCDAVTVDWIQQRGWKRLSIPGGDSWYGNQVRCHVRGGVDLTQCAHDPAGAHSTVTRAK